MNTSATPIISHNYQQQNIVVVDFDQATSDHLDRNGNDTLMITHLTIACLLAWLLTIYLWSKQCIIKFESEQAGEQGQRGYKTASVATVATNQ